MKINNHNNAIIRDDSQDIGGKYISSKPKVWQTRALHKSWGVKLPSISKQIWNNDFQRGKLVRCEVYDGLHA